MIDELKEALAECPENPFLQGHVSALDNMEICTNCTHCGPRISGNMIRCDHPEWGDEDTEMREIDMTFGGWCADYSRVNAEVSRRDR